jgi:hypothetical protein
VTLPSPHTRRPAGLAALALLSAGTLLYELVLMRVFSVLMWYHFASLAIGLALLGLGAGGLAVGLAPGVGRPARRPAWALLFGAGAASVLLFLVTVHAWPELARFTLAPFHQPFYKPFERPETTNLDAGLALRLTGLVLGTGWPFFFAGAATAGLLAERAPRIGPAYAATFLGSAAGCAAFPLLLSLVSAPAGLAAAAAAGAGAAALWAPPGRGRAASWAVAALLAGAGLWAHATGAAEIPFARGRYEPALLAVRWNAMSRVAAYPLPPDDTLRPYGLSSRYKGPQPRQIGVVVDDSGYTNLFDGAESAANPEYFRANLVALPFHLRPEAKALLFGPGGGKDVWIALSFPGVSVRAVEINPQVVEMAEETFAAFTGRPYSRPGVSLSVSDARRFARIDRGRYDVIEASSVFGRLPPTAGAFTLSEDVLHTAEAFGEYWDRLEDDGILSITRFAYEQRALRLTALARELLDRKGVRDPGRHVRVLTDRGLANVMVSRRPFDAADDARLREVAARYGFEFLYPHPGPGASLLSRLVDAPTLREALPDVPFDVSPPTDDRPFFYYTVRPSDFLRGHIPGQAGFDDRGAEILRLSFLVMLALALLTLVAPVALARGLPRGAGAGAPLAFFFAVGCGYMALEIGTMKRLVLLLGHPIYAVSVTLLAFLLGSGAGSLLAGRLASTRGRLMGWLAAAAGLGLFQALLAPALLAPVALFPTPLRFAAAALAALPLAFALGIPFPAATARLGGMAGALLPWAWAVNGTASVAASLGAVLVAMNYGYTATLTAGALLYVLALLLTPWVGGAQAGEGRP